MPTYPVTIRRCQHIKVNGIQCGSPAKRNEMHCFFHEQCRLMSRRINMKFSEEGVFELPTLEDANSIQLCLNDVMRMVVTRQIDHRIASLVLRALRIAADNVKFTSLEPKPTYIVIDPKSVEHRPLGATAWSTVEGQEYDIEENREVPKEQQKHDVPKHDLQKNDKPKKEAKQNPPRTPEDLACERDWKRLVEGVGRDPNFLDTRRPAPTTAQPPQTSPPSAESQELRPENQEPTTRSGELVTEDHP